MGGMGGRIDFSHILSIYPSGALVTLSFFLSFHLSVSLSLSLTPSLCCGGVLVFFVSVFIVPYVCIVKMFNCV